MDSTVVKEKLGKYISIEKNIAIFTRVLIKNYPNELEQVLFELCV